MLAGICLFLTGSWLSGLAGEFGDLPLLGGGALFTTAFAIIADLFPPRERSKFGGLFGAVCGFSSAIGPLLGGYFTDRGTVTLFCHVVAGWRWVFYLNLPVGLVALIMVIAKMPLLRHASKGKIDFAGAGLLIGGCMPLLLAPTLGCQAYAWTSPTVLGLFAMFVVCTAIFIVVEQSVEKPILHLELFKNPVFTWCNIASFLSSMTFLSVVVFLPLFIRLGQVVNATVSGLSTLPLTVGLVMSSAVASRTVHRTGRSKLFMLGGVCMVLIGTFLLSQMGPDTTRTDMA